jgi:hypothetical protein
VISEKQLADAGKYGLALRLSYAADDGYSGPRLILATRYDKRSKLLSGIQIAPSPGKSERRSFKLAAITHCEEYRPPFTNTDRKGRCILIKDLDEESLLYIRQKLLEELDTYSTEWTIRDAKNPDYLLGDSRAIYAYSLDWWPEVITQLSIRKRSVGKRSSFSRFPRNES